MKNITTILGNAKITLVEVTFTIDNLERTIMLTPEEATNIPKEVQKYANWLVRQRALETAQKILNKK